MFSLISICCNETYKAKQKMEHTNVFTIHYMRGLVIQVNTFICFSSCLQNYTSLSNEKKQLNNFVLHHHTYPGQECFLIQFNWLKSRCKTTFALAVSINNFVQLIRNNLFPQPSPSSGHSALLSVSFSSFTSRLRGRCANAA